MQMLAGFLTCLTSAAAINDQCVSLPWRCIPNSMPRGIPPAPMHFQQRYKPPSLPQVLYHLVHTVKNIRGNWNRFGRYETDSLPGVVRRKDYSLTGSRLFLCWQLQVLCLPATVHDTSVIKKSFALHECVQSNLIPKVLSELGLAVLLCIILVAATSSAIANRGDALRHLSAGQDPLLIRSAANFLLTTSPYHLQHRVCLPNTTNYCLITWR